MRVRANYDPDYDPREFAVDCSEGIGADQSFTKDCDIHYILRRVGMGGEIVPRADYATAMYEDLSNVPGDYLEALNLVEQAQDHFESLPARVREKFSNDPYQLLNFLADDQNREEAYRIGLLERPVAPAVNTPAGSAAPVAPVVGSDASSGSAVGQKPTG